MKTKTMKIVIMALLAVLLSNIAYAQVCDGIASAPTKEVYVGDDFNISFYNLDTSTVGDTITLTLPSGINLISGTNPIVSPTNMTAYTWMVRANTTGTFTFNVTVAGSNNCTASDDAVIVEEAIPPILIGSATDLGTLTINQPVAFIVSLTNYGGDASSVGGVVSTSSGSPVTPSSFTHGLLTNGSTMTDSYSLTPGYCGGDKIVVNVTNVKDSNGYDAASTYVQDLFTVVGSDNAFTTINAESPVAQGDPSTFGYTVWNIGTFDSSAITVTILVDGTVVHTDSIGALTANTSITPPTYEQPTASLALGTHSITFRLTANTECSSDNNEVGTTFNVGASSLPVCGNSIIESGETCDSGNLNSQTCATLGLGFSGGTLTCSAGCATFNTTACTTTPPVCGDGICNGAETTATCSADCSATPGPVSGGGGGGSGGGSGNYGTRIYILNLSKEHPTQTFQLRNGDTVKYLYNGVDYSMLFRSIGMTQSTMGLSKTDGYQTYAFYTGVSYDLNLDDKSTADLGIKAYKNHIGYGNFTFSLIGVSDDRQLFLLPFLNKLRTPKTQETNQTTEMAAEPTTESQEEEVFAEGLLDFVETLDVRSTAPLWSGIGIAALIILVGLGSYFIITRKGSDEDAPITVEKSSKSDEDYFKLPATKIKVGKRR